MATPSVSDELLNRAAELRAQGNSWETVAAAVHRTADRVRRWPREQAGRWRAALKRAEDDYTAHLTAESKSTLRNQLRNEDVKTSQVAAVALLKHGVDRPKPVAKKSTPHRSASQAAVRMAEFVEALSDDEILQLLEMDLEIPAAAAAVPSDAAAATADPPGTAGAECVP